MNDHLILVVNPGSSSIKFGLYQITDVNLKRLCHGAIDGAGAAPRFSVTCAESFDSHDEALALDTETIETHAALQTIEAWLSRHYCSSNIIAVACRVVHGGDQYDEPVVVNELVLKHLCSLTPMAPLHQPVCTTTIRYFLKAYPKAQHWACFDTSFHRTMPHIAQTFALPASIRQQGIKPYGFHGLSYQSIVNQLSTLLENKLPSRCVVAHLGSGSSMCAILDGKSIATTMTFSPLDGLPMATRCGRLDAGAVIYLIDQLKLSPDDVLQLLNHESGLAGLSGLSGDIQELMQSPTEDAQFALAYFVYAVVRALGEMVATLGGIDALVFTGGIGANSAEIRQNICSHFQWLGLTINPQANNERATKISSVESQIDVFSLKTDEELVMAKRVLDKFNAGS